MDSSRLTFLFNRYINQTCTEQEKAEFMQLIDKKEYDVQLKHLMSSLWELAGADQKLPSDKKDQIVRGILETAERNSSIKKHKSIFSNPVKIAASLSFLLLCFCAWYFNSDLKYQNENATTSLQRTLTQQEHQIVKLPDGSVVKLNTGSTLAYPESFDDKESREVFLTGEAYFDISHDATKAFIVHTGKLKTTVLGTAFNIKAYPQDKNIIVTVTRGKVKVSDAEKTIGIIVPDQQITFDKNAAQAAQQVVDSRNTIAWSDNDIFFDDVTLAQAVKQLEERFHVSIAIDNEKLKECRFTATFVRGEDLDQMLIVMCEFNGSHFSRDVHGTIRIEGKGC